MQRFECVSGGNPHHHGFNVGACNPRLSIMRDELPDGAKRLKKSVVVESTDETELCQPCGGGAGIFAKPVEGRVEDVGAEADSVPQAAMVREGLP